MRKSAIQKSSEVSTSVKSKPVRHEGSPPSSYSFLELHQMLGNRAMGRFVQAKLQINTPGDAYEQEADRIAELVMRLPEPLPFASNHTDSSLPDIQRMCAECARGESLCPKCAEDEEEMKQRKPLATRIRPILQGQVGMVQREESERAKETSGAIPTASPSLENQIDSLRGRGQPLPASVRAFFEPRFGMDFSGVRVHRDHQTAISARAFSARAYTTGQDIFFGAGEYAPETAEGKKLLGHELTHVVQQFNRQSYISRQVTDATQMSITSEYTQNLNDEALMYEIDQVRAQLMNLSPQADIYTSAQENLRILEHEATRRIDDAIQTRDSALNNLTSQDAYFDPNSRTLANYTKASDRLIAFGKELPEEPDGIYIPPGQLLVVDETGQVQLIHDKGIVDISDDLFPILENLVRVSQGGALSSAGFGKLEQILLWEDKRAVITNATTADLPTLLINGRPSEFESGRGITGLNKPWERVRDASIHGVLTSGIYQLGSHPISSFSGVRLPAGARIRFADVGRWLSGGMESRVMTIFQPGTRRFYAWDRHLPVGNTPHPLWHVKQRGMHGLFGQANHAPMTPAQIAQGRALRFMKIGGRVFLVAGIIGDGARLTSSIVESIERGSPHPAIAESVRVAGGWGGAWAGTKLGCTAGGAIGIETGPGAVLTCMVGGLIGGIASFFGADWIADMINVEKGENVTSGSTSGTGFGGFQGGEFGGGGASGDW